MTDPGNIRLSPAQDDVIRQVADGVPVVRRQLVSARILEFLGLVRQNIAVPAFVLTAAGRAWLDANPSEDEREADDRQQDLCPRPAYGPKD